MRYRKQTRDHFSRFWIKLGGERNNAPLRVGDRLVVNRGEKVEIIAKYFAEKLAAPGNAAEREWARRPRECPLPPFREQLPGTFREVTMLEVARGVLELALRRAPGPDGMPAALFRQMPALVSAIAPFYYIVLKKGDIPRGLSRLYLIPILKPNGGPRSRESQGPISLLNATVKILVSVIYDRIVEQVEPILSPSQFPTGGTEEQKWR